MAGTWRTEPAEGGCPQLGADAWDLLILLLMLPITTLMGSQLPSDWAHHNGDSLPGTAVVTALDPYRGGYITLVEVRSATGELVATRSEINGDAPERLGATFPVSYVIDDDGDALVYTAGHDPFDTNLAIFVPCLLACLIALPFVGARAVRLVAKVRARLRARPGHHYEAGRGYVCDEPQHRRRSHP